MKLTVLGNYGPYPKAGTGATSGYLLEENGTKLVLDMGAGCMAKLLAATDVKDVDAIFISHLHFDHTSDLLPFRYLLDDLGITMKILTQKEDSEWYRVLFGHPKFEIVNIDETTELTVGDLRLSFTQLIHPAKDYAVKIRGEKTFVYTGDTVMCPALYKAAEGADAILCDCAKPEDFKGPHMCAADAKEFREKTGIHIFATHLSPSFVPEEVFGGTEGFTVTEADKTYEI